MDDLLPFPPAELAKTEGVSGMVPALRKEFTGARLTDEEREVILAKFAAGKTRVEIAAEMRMGRNTVAAEIRRAENDGRLPACRERMASKLEELCDDHLELRMRDPGEMSALDFAIYFDKGQLLKGAPTSIVSLPQREDEAAVLQQLQRLTEGIIDVEVVPVTPTENPCPQAPNQPSPPTQE